VNPEIARNDDDDDDHTDYVKEVHCLYPGCSFPKTAQLRP